MRFTEGRRERALRQAPTAAELAWLRQQFEAELQTYAVLVAEQAIPYDTAFAELMVDHALPFWRRYPRFDLLDLEDRIGDRLTDAAMEHEFARARLPRIWAIPRKRRRCRVHPKGARYAG